MHPYGYIQTRTDNIVLIHSLFSIVILCISRTIHSLCLAVPCQCRDAPSDPQIYIRPSLWSSVTLFIVLFRYIGYLATLSIPILSNHFGKFCKMGHNSYLDFLSYSDPLSQSKHNHKNFGLSEPVRVLDYPSL